MANLGVRMTNKRGTMSSLVMMVLVARVTRVVEGQADLLASVIEFSDYPDEIKFSEEYPDEDSDLMRRLDNGVPINVIQRPVTGLETSSDKSRYESLVSLNCPLRCQEFYNHALEV